ncbi:F-box protein At5g49610-like [Corylus avellana]|uniref:F-box protein At5g49610-like n=1 Tax=Corylus avellana TaxID=13451 RepID=UPI00286C0D61|nr:F-box protein At5g49610-like [Corylus avellana]
MNPGEGLRVKQATYHGDGAKPKEFPSDILFDIFSRLPIKTLLRFKCVSPLWCTIIDDPYLARLHRLQCVEKPKVLVLEPTRKPAVPVFREDRSGILRFVSRKLNAYSLESCCNGLLCFTRIFVNCNHSPLFLVNLQRQQVVELPRPPCIGTPWPPVHTSDSDCKCSYGLGFDCATNTYKIVVVFFSGNPGQDGNLCAQVYTLGGRGSSWRPVKGPPNCSFYDKPECERGFYEMPVYARGALHWLVKPQGYNLPWLFKPPGYNDVPSHEFQRDLINIVYFDVGKEEFGLISPPRSRTGTPFHLVDLGGDLAVVIIKYHFWLIQIWVMKEYDQKKEWVQEYKIYLDQVNSILPSIRVMGLFEDGEILVTVNWKSFLFYNPKTDVLKRRRHYIPRVFDFEREVLCHNMGTLLSLDMFREEGSTLLSLDMFQEE